MSSRLRIALALAAIAALGVGLVACGGGGSSDESPEAVLENATLEGIESADLDLSLQVKSTGKEASDLDVSVSGPFEEQEGSELPQMDIEVTAKGNYKGDDVDFDGGLVLLPNSAFVRYEGVEYEVDPTSFSFVESLLDHSQKESGAESNGIKGCREAVGTLDFTKLGEGLKNEGSADVGGTETTKLSGELDPKGASDLLTELTRKPGLQGPAQRRRQDPVGRRPEEVRRRTQRLAEDRARRVLRRRRRHRPPDRRRRRRRTEGLGRRKERNRPRPDAERRQRGTGNRRADRSQAAQRALPQARHQSARTRRGAAARRRPGVDPEAVRKEGPPRARRRDQRRSGGGEGGAERALSYAECVRGAQSAADLQKCSEEL